MDEKDFLDLPLHVRSTILHAGDLISKGCEVHFKFTCQHCGQRCTFTDKNSYFKEGECDECKGFTDTRLPEANLNFMVIASGDAALHVAADLGLLGTEPPPIKES